jgi:excisionase family DNA binding protein
MEPLAVDVREAGRLLSVSKYTIRRLIRRGVLQAVRISRRLLVPVAEIERISREGVRATGPQRLPENESNGGRSPSIS